MTSEADAIPNSPTRNPITSSNGTSDDRPESYFYKDLKMYYKDLNIKNEDSPITEIYLNKEELTPQMKIFNSYESEVAFLSYIQESMKVFKCPTHDFSHVIRVTNLAMFIALRTITSFVFLKLAFVSALCHDLLDKKLCTDSMSAGDLLKSMLQKHINIEPHYFDVIFFISTSVGYKNLIKQDWNIERILRESKILPEGIDERYV